MRERDYYPEIRNWLEKQLKSRYPRARIIVTYETHKTKLSEYIFSKGLSNLIPDFDTFEFKSDITGFIVRRMSCALVLVECKRIVDLTSIAQMVGYAKVSHPSHAFLISITGFVSPAVKKLLQERKRYDLLEFDSDKLIRIAKWDSSKKDVSYDMVIPMGNMWDRV